MKKYILIFCILIISNHSFAATQVLKSLDQTVVQSAIDAASDGAIIELPSGVVTWTTVTASTPAVKIRNKNITLVGQGIGSTTIIAGTNDTFMTPAIWAQNDTDKPFRISKISFKQAISAQQGIIHILGGSKSWRIDHCSFEGTTGVGNLIMVGGTDITYGVIDNCTFSTVKNVSCKAVQIISRITGENGTSPLYGAASWALGLTLGTANAVYIEDCTFNWDVKYVILDVDDGGRLVFRHNTILGGGVGTHGMDGTYKHNGVFSYEIYNNTFNSNGKQMWAAIGLRGGTGVIYNNTFSGNYSDTTALYCYCGCNPPGGNCTAWPMCTYPCPGQIGRTTGQVLSPLYLWSNTYNDGLHGINLTAAASTCAGLNDIYQEGRDYYSNTAKPDYVSYQYPHPLTQIKPDTSPLNWRDTYVNGSYWTRYAGGSVYILQPNKYKGNTVNKVNQDGFALGKQGSIAACASTKASYYFDSSDGNLYVHSTDDADPNTHRIDVYYN